MQETDDVGAPSLSAAKALAMQNPRPFDLPETNPELTGNPDHVSADELESTLSTMQSLLENAMSRHRGRRVTSDTLVTTTDPKVAREAMDDMLSRAKWTVSVVLPSERRAAEVVMSGIDRAEPRWSEAIRVRMLASSAAASHERMIEYSRRRPWLEVRVNEARYPSVVVVDLHCALIRANRADTGWQASMIREIAIINAMHAMFSGGWQGGVPLHEDVATDELLGRDMVADIIGHLTEGRTDEYAAREMSISVRTYRRYVAEIMDNLGATSRFQAGVKAAEHGLVRRAASRRTR